MPGSAWSAQNGVWILVGCPPGYFLNAQQCQICPAAFYCTGGSVPSTPCSAGHFTLPGANVSTSCVPAVFVVVTVNLQISRPAFTDAQSELFQGALADSADSEAGYIIIDVIKSGDTPTATTITAKVAKPNAETAAALAAKLDANTVQAGFISRGFLGATLVSVH